MVGVLLYAGLYIYTNRHPTSLVLHEVLRIYYLAHKPEKVATLELFVVLYQGTGGMARPSLAKIRQAPVGGETQPPDVDVLLYVFFLLWPCLLTPRKGSSVVRNTYRVAVYLDGSMDGWNDNRQHNAHTLTRLQPRGVVNSGTGRS